VLDGLMTKGTVTLEDVQMLTYGGEPSSG